MNKRGKNKRQHQLLNGTEGGGENGRRGEVAGVIGKIKRTSMPHSNRLRERRGIGLDKGVKRK